MPNGVITDYNVWYNQTLNCNGSLVSFSDSVAGSVLMYTFTELEEDTVYVFYVSAETSAGEGEAAMVMGRTSEDGECVFMCVLFKHDCLTQHITYICMYVYTPLFPPPVPSAAPEFTLSTTSTSITVSWQPLPSCDQNGVITNYTIAYRMEGGTDMSFNVVDAANRMHVVKPLTPYTNYTIKMAASTSVGRGDFGPEMTVQTNESSEAPVIPWSLCYGDKLFVCTGVLCKPDTSRLCIVDIY